MDSDYPKFPNDWDIDEYSQLQYYKKCFPYVKKSEDFDTFVNKSKSFHIFGIVAIIYFVLLSFMLIKNRNHFILKRQGRIYFLLFMIGSIVNSTSSFVFQVFYLFIYLSIYYLFISFIHYY